MAAPVWRAKYRRHSFGVKNSAVYAAQQVLADRDDSRVNVIKRYACGYGLSQEAKAISFPFLHPEVLPVALLIRIHPEGVQSLKFHEGKMSKFCSFEDVQKFHELTFQWSVAYDTKDLSIMLAVTTPKIVVDYRDFPAVNTIRECTPEEFFKHTFSEEGLGDKRLQTQHLLGASVFKPVSDDEATGNWQIRARHVRTFADGKTADWDASSFAEYRYVKVDGAWKIGGWRPHTVVAATGRHDQVVGRF